MATEALAEMMVGFAVSLDELNSIPSSASAVFNAMAESAASASEEISASFEATGQAAESFAEMSRMAAENAAEAMVAPQEAMSELVSASDEDAASIGEAFSSINFDAFQGALISLTEAVDAAVSQIDEQLATIPTQAEESAAKSKESFSGFNLGGMITQVGMGIFAFQNMANMGVQLAGGLLDPAMNAEKMQESFTNLTGSAQTATDELSKLDDFAAKTQFKTLDIDAAGAQLLGFGFKAKDIIPDITAVGDNLSAVGKGTPAEVQQVIDIFGKMSTQGKITAMDINQLGAHGITALADIAAGAGTSTTAISDMIKKGTLPAKTAIDDLTAGIEKNPIYAGGMAKQSGTLSGIMSTLSSDWDQFMATIAAPALPLLEQGLSKLTTLLTDPNFKAFAKTVGVDIVNGFIAFANNVTKLINDGQQLVNFFKQNQTAMNALVAVLITLGGIIAGLILPGLIAWGIEQMIVAAGVIATAAPFILLGVIAAAVIFGIIEAVQHWGAIMTWLQGIWQHVVDFWQNDVVKPFQNTIGAIGNAFNGMLKIAQEVGDGIGHAIKGGINDIIGVINGFIGFIDSIQIHIPAIGVGPVHTPALDWNGLGIPKIPLLFTGGFVAPGHVAVAGDQGPELVFGGTSGASVLSNSNSMAAMGGSQQQAPEIHNHIYIDGREISNQIMVQVLSQMRSSGHPNGGI
jgi:tape measure domain-containing protein